MIGTRNPTMAEAVTIVSNQLTKSGQAAQLRFMAETQGRDFAIQVRAKVLAEGKGRKK